MPDTTRTIESIFTDLVGSDEALRENPEAVLVARAIFSYGLVAALDVGAAGGPQELMRQVNAFVKGALAMDPLSSPDQPQ